LPSLNVLIRPKVDIPDLFFLLSYATHLRWAPEAFPSEHTEDIFASLVRFFDAEMERVRVFGLPRDYIETRDTLPTIRGRIDIAEQLRRRQLQPYPLECRFADYTDDIPMNRVLKEAHAVALAIPGLDPGLSARIRLRYRRLFATVVTEPMDTDLRSDVHFTHLTAHWEPAYWLANLLLSFRSLRDEEGHIVGRAFTVRMDRVFERFVEIVVTEELSEAGFEVSPQMPVSLTGCWKSPMSSVRRYFTSATATVLPFFWITRSGRMRTPSRDSFVSTILARSVARRSQRSAWTWNT
jgi:5-methylcytosine-specific restriction enzyme subunit McrC